LRVVKKVPKGYALALAFQRLTGVRPQEAIQSLHLISKLQAEEKLGDYYDTELNMLQHFKYESLFLRRTKNVFISFVSPELMKVALAISKLPTWDALTGVINRRKLGRKMDLLRKDFATSLRHKGIPRESIDIIQGRISADVFSQHYYRPSLKVLCNQVLGSLRPLEEELLKNITN